MLRSADDISLLANIRELEEALNVTETVFIFCIIGVTGGLINRIISGLSGEVVIFNDIRRRFDQDVGVFLFIMRDKFKIRHLSFDK